MHGIIEASGRHIQRAIPGGNVILAATHANITGSIYACGSSCAPSYQNYHSGFGYQSNTFGIQKIQGDPGTISIQYDTGKITGQCTPALSPATLRYNRETNLLQKC